MPTIVPNYVWNTMRYNYYSVKNILYTWNHSVIATCKDNHYIKHSLQYTPIPALFSLKRYIFLFEKNALIIETV